MIFKVNIEYFYDHHRETAEYTLYADDAESAERRALNDFEHTRAFDSIDDVTVEEIPLGI